MWVDETLAREVPRLPPAAGPSPAPSPQFSSFIERLIAAGRSGLCLALVAAAVLIFVGSGVFARAMRPGEILHSMAFWFMSWDR